MGQSHTARWWTDRNASSNDRRRSVLLKYGYNVAKVGGWNPRINSAWEHFIRHQGNKHKGAHSWNVSETGHTGGPRRFKMANPRAGAGTQYPTAVGPPAPKARPKRNRGGGGANRDGGGGGYTDPDMMPVDDPYADPDQFPGIPPVDMKGFRTSRMIPRSMADTLAGMQFDPQIQELLGQIARGRRDTAQHKADIGAWYDQVGRSQETARQRDVEAGEGARRSVQGALDSILASLGGSRGAGVVGASGLADLTDLAAQGASQDRYNADTAPLLQAERAGALSRETAMGSQRRSALDQALVGVRGQRGQARAKALLDIIAANNQGRQTNFQNRLALQNAAMAGASLGLNADQAYAGIANQREANRLNRQQLKLQALAAQQKSGRMNWATLNYPDRQTVVHDAVGRAVAGLVQGRGHWDPTKVYQDALAYLRSGGFKAAQPYKVQGKFNKRNRQQINQAVYRAIEAAQRAWNAKYPDE